MLKRLSSLPIEQQDALYLEVLSKLDENTERGSQLRTLLAMLYLYSSKGVNEIHLKRTCSAFKTPVEVMDFLMKRGAEIKCIRGRYRLNAFDDGEKFQMTFKTTYLYGESKCAINTVEENKTSALMNLSSAEKKSDVRQKTLSILAK